MKTARFTRLLSFILCALLIAALALTVFGCKDSRKDDISSAPVSTETAVSLGQGEKEFTFKFRIMPAIMGNVDPFGKLN